MKKLQSTDKVLWVFLLSMGLLLIYIELFFLLHSKTLPVTPIHIAEQDMRIELSSDDSFTLYVKQVHNLDKIVLLDEEVTQEAHPDENSLLSYALLYKEDSLYSPLVSSSIYEHPELGPSLSLTIPFMVYKEGKTPVDLLSQPSILVGMISGSTLLTQPTVKFAYIDIVFINEEAKKLHEVSPAMNNSKVISTQDDQINNERNDENISIRDKVTPSVSDFRFNHYSENGYVVGLEDSGAIDVKISSIILQDVSNEELSTYFARIIDKNNKVIANISFYEEEQKVYGKLINLIDESRPIAPYDIIVLQRIPREAL